MNKPKVINFSTEAEIMPARFGLNMNNAFTDCADVALLREMVTYLYDLLDDIDTISDIAKTNDVLYRKMVEQVQQHKAHYLYSDGYKLFIEENRDERPKTMYEIFSEELRNR